MIKFQLQPESSELLLLFVSVIYACYAFGTAFIICELCEQISNLFNEINVSIGQLSWYYFPYKLQRILPTILVMSQKPFKIECFGSITCSRDTFKKVSLKNRKTNPITHWIETKSFEHFRLSIKAIHTSMCCATSWNEYTPSTGCKTLSTQKMELRTKIKSIWNFNLNVSSLCSIE